ncbi:MAG: hypothetical protein NTU41_09230, partial [Chloroflexi bacterium]|nr:hypothetical protein [Chloroflexota bacterium]
KDYAAANGGSTIAGASPTIDNAGGYVGNISYAILGAGTGGPSGTGTLCTLSFTAKAGGTGSATIVPSGIVVSDASGAPIAGVVATGGTVAMALGSIDHYSVSSVSSTQVAGTAFSVTIQARDV